MCSDFKIDIDKTGPICRSVRYGERAENISNRKLISYERNPMKITNAGPGVGITYRRLTLSRRLDTGAKVPNTMSNKGDVTPKRSSGV